MKIYSASYLIKEGVRNVDRGDAAGITLGIFLLFLFSLWQIISAFSSRHEALASDSESPFTDREEEHSEDDRLDDGDDDDDGDDGDDGDEGDDGGESGKDVFDDMIKEHEGSSMKCKTTVSFIPYVGEGC